MTVTQPLTDQEAGALHKAVATDLLPPLPDLDLCDGGYDWIVQLRRTGWQEIAGLAVGTLLGDWPYQVVAHHSDPERDLYGLAVFTEGDVSVEGFRSRAERDEATRAYAETEEDGE